LPLRRKRKLANSQSLIVAGPIERPTSPDDCKYKASSPVLGRAGIAVKNQHSFFFITESIASPGAGAGQSGGFAALIIKW